MFRNEFDRQAENLLQKAYHNIAGITEAEFLKHIEPLREAALHRETDGKAPEEGRIPFVIVVKRELIAPFEAMQLVERNDKKSLNVMDAEEMKRFKPIEGVELPGGKAYLLVDIDTGKETLNVTPNEALITIREANRSPLTLEEGIALVTHYPEAVKKNHGFSLLGSRCGDRRVTALWISKGQAKLGWCWAGNPHTWLGSASCGGRAG